MVGCTLYPFKKGGYKYNNQPNAKYKYNTTRYNLQPHKFQTTFPVHEPHGVMHRFEFQDGFARRQAGQTLCLLGTTFAKEHVAAAGDDPPDLQWGASAVQAKRIA